MSLEKTIKKRVIRRKYRVRKKISGFGKIREQLFRVSVFKSLNHIYVQVIDDLTSHTVASSSTQEHAFNGTKVEKARLVGLNLGETIKRLDLKKIVFDRGAYKYHGRVKAIAEGIREAGIAI
jgi:large subunit ribosomal protein L18